MINTTYSNASLTINLTALKKNYFSLIKKLSTAELAAVVKANAYGLGINQVAILLSRLGCVKFFVATLDEGIELRQILPNAKIFVFHGAPSGAENEFVANSLIPVINTIKQLENWLPHSEHSAALHSMA